MAKQADGSTADDPTATGVLDGSPDRQTGGEESPSLPGQGSTIEIPEEDHDRILSHFKTSPNEDDGDEVPHGTDDDPEKPGEGADDDDDLVDLSQQAENDDDPDDVDDDEPDDTDVGDDEPTDLAGDDDGDHDDREADDFTDDELDSIAEKMEKQEVGKAFAHLRKKAKRADDLEDAAELGVRFNNLVERSGLGTEGVKELTVLLGAVKSDPLRAIQMLKGKLRDAATAAKERYGDKLDLAPLMDLEGADGPAPVELPTWLEEAVDSGILSQEDAEKQARLIAGDAEPPAGDDPGGDGMVDEQGQAYPDDVVEAYRDSARERLSEMGFYRVPKKVSKTEQQRILDDRIDRLLIPEMDRMAQEEGLDLETCHPRDRKEIMVRAGKNVMAKLKTQRRRKAGKPLRQSEGHRPTSKEPQKGPESEEDFNSRVLSKFKPTP